MDDHACIDCIKAPPKTVRKTVAGETPLRCATHSKMRKVARRKAARASHVERTYGISADDNAALYVYQGGKCWICRKATGAVKQLAVDHDHADDWVRGRLCGECNQFIGQRLGDDPAAAQRLVRYLRGGTPYRQMLAERWLTANGLPFDPGTVWVEVSRWPSRTPTVLISWEIGGMTRTNYLELPEIEAMKA